MNISRYIVEDNSKASVMFDLNCTNDINIVRSVFKNLVGGCDIKTPNEYRKIHLNLSKVTIIILY